jgi:xylonate dehydratase
VKATAIDPSVIGGDGVFRHRGVAKVFTSERDAVAAIKGEAGTDVGAGDVVVLIGAGPLGTGMEEVYQVTSALKYLPWGKHVAVVTDARFSGVSTGACIGHVAPEALAGGPVGRLRDGDLVDIEIDRVALTGRVDFLGPSGTLLEPGAAAAVLAGRDPHPDLAPAPDLPDDTRLWAALQRASGGPARGCIYDVDRIVAAIDAGLRTLDAGTGR